MRFPTRWLPASCTLAAALLLTTDSLADRVVTMDGRQLTAKKARKLGDGYKLEFEHGTIILKDGSLVKAVEIEGDMSDYVPQDDREREFLKKGYVRYRNVWMSKRVYERELVKEAEVSREAADAASAYADWGVALEGESRYFKIRTNTSPELLDYYGRLLDAYYKLMNKRVGIKPTPMMRGVKLWVNIYKNRAEFTRISQMSPGVAGFFMPAERDATLNFYHDYPDPSTSQWVALHECTHLLTYLIDQQFRSQIWINEAVADYFGSSTIEEDKRGKITIIPGKLQTDRVLTVQQAIKDDKAISLPDLFRLEKSGFGAFQYAHAWSFVYFLQNGQKGKYSKGFDKFFKALYTLEKGVPYETRPSFGKSGTGFFVKPDDIRDLLLKKIRVKDLAGLEKEWLTFIEAIPIDAPGALLKRGLRGAMRGRYDEALKDLTRAIDGGITDSRAFGTRARAYMLKRNKEGARSDIARAIELDPLNAEYRYHQSCYLIGLNPMFGYESLDDDDKQPEAISAAGLAVELDPENDRYQEWLEMLTN